ncbi:glycosyltransferase family 9 protein [Candidatus Woesearchaeota archaeon]|nr:glycosyltransferase family 9 protein [Candidatus Woesearchaeota archaeon]
MENKWNRDCRSFKGVYSCDIMTGEDYRDCSECGFYDKIGKKILILKLGAMGDVVRGTTILPALKEKYGQDSHITWVIDDKSKEILYNNPYVDRILSYNNETVLILQQEKFDVLLSLEVSPPTTLIANLINVEEKYGFYFDGDGHPSAYKKGALEHLETVFSNKLSKECKKTHQEMLFNNVELDYKKQDYVLILEDYEKEYASDVIGDKKRKIIGINVGSAGRWVSKAWHPDLIIEFIKKISKDYDVILLGGKREEELLNDIENSVKKERISVLKNDPENSVREFMAVINACDLIITGDTLALHLAIGLKKKTIALFFCAPPWQIEDYSFFKKIISPLLDKYYMDDRYIEELVNSISVDEVLGAVKSL